MATAAKTALNNQKSINHYCHHHWKLRSLYLGNYGHGATKLFIIPYFCTSIDF